MLVANKNQNGFICQLQKYMINVYLSKLSNSFGYIDIILLNHEIHHSASKYILGRKLVMSQKFIQDLKKNSIYLKTKLNQLNKIWRF